MLAINKLHLDCNQPSQARMIRQECNGSAEIGTLESGGIENAGPENAGQIWGTGKRGNGKRRTNVRYRKARDNGQSVLP